MLLPRNRTDFIYGHGVGGQECCVTNKSLNEKRESIFDVLKQTKVGLKSLFRQTEKVMNNIDFPNITKMIFDVSKLYLPLF